MKTQVMSFFNARVFKKGLVFLLVLALLGWLISSQAMFEGLNEQWIDLHIRNNGASGVLYFVLICMTATAVGCPRQLVAFLGGYAFGFVNGALLSTVGTALGCMMSFFFARLAIRPLVDRRYSHRILKVNRFLAEQPVMKTIVIRLLPVGNNLVTNLVAGVTKVKGRYFILGSLVGYLPQMAIFALMGKGIVVLSVWKIMLSVLLFCISSALSVRLYQQYKAAQTLEDEPDSDLVSDSVQP
ncbi:MAG: putative membrane protein YdjX (TVP38/TMEM64 family) [Paraglaciecola sp.]|jgi:uncharacterized membrane protein YdjX (TVP38/TMEM64 family)